MKNTMKKLLSLVLVAMLLVCAVPFQAAATEADETLTVKTYVDGKYVTDKYVTVKPGQKLELTKELAETLIYGDKEFVKWTNMKDEETTGPISYDNLKKANANGYYVNLYLNKKVEDTRVDAKVPVEIYVDGSYARDGEITVPVDGAVTLTKELGLKLVREDKEFVKWTGASDNEATGVTIKYAGIDDGYSLKLFVNTKKAEEPADAPSATTDEASSSTSQSEAPSDVSYPDVQARVIGLAKHSRDAATGLLGEFGASHGKELKEEQWAEFVAAADAKIAEYANA